jgi:hypothetical protein
MGRSIDGTSLLAAGGIRSTFTDGGAMNRNRIFTAGAVLAGVLVWAACGSSSSSSNNNNTDGGTNAGTCGGAGKGCITGTVLIAGTTTALGDVTVSSGGVDLATGNAQGYYFADSVPAGNPVAVCYSKTGYVRRCRNLTVRDGQAVSVTNTELQPVLTSAPVAVNAAGTVTGTGIHSNAQVSLTANTTCTSGTTAATGTLTCSITPLDVSQASQRSLAPGDFSATDTAGNTVQLVSSGMMDITCTDASGHRVTLCTGATAAAKIPIYSNCTDLTKYPATITSWSFNEATGRWKQEASFTKAACTGTGAASTGYYTGTVSHFSYWNADQVATTTCLKGAVKDTNGRNVDGALVRCSGTSYQGDSEAYTAADGTFCVGVMAGGAYSCVAAKGGFASTAITGTASATAAACGSASCATLGTGTITLQDPLMRTILTWGQYPSDLDSHTVGTGSVASTHVWYVDKGNLGAAPFIGLDTDDVSSYGPEITTVMPSVAPGTYRFCVHNYSGEPPAGTTQGSLAASQATVDVFAPGLHKTYTVPTSNPNRKDVWRVYEASIGSNGTVTIRDLNDFVGQTDTPDVAAACAQ